MNSVALTRREYLKTLAAGTLSAPFLSTRVHADAESPRPKRIAAVVTEYRKNSHADVLVGKVLDGWKQDGGPGPALKLVSMYVDQFPESDLARVRAREHNVPIYGSIAESLTLGGDGIAVDGVLSIGEHGQYPYNDKGQHLYPRRRFFREITGAFEKHGRVVPVFNDKHPGPEWDDARWMYDRARELNVPFMAGSSLPVSYRKPDLSVPVGTEIEAAVGVGYSGLDIYGIHTLECYQTLVEKRRGAESGVEWVQCLQGPAMWKTLDAGTVRPDLLEAALQVIPRQDNAAVDLARLRELEGDDVALFLFKYRDGFQGAVFMLAGYAGGISAAIATKDKPQPQATYFEERAEPYYPHFAYLLKAIERMMHTGKPSYPVERTMLTSGILDRVLTSRHGGYKKLQTPELAISYQPVDYPHAPNPSLQSSPLAG